MGPRHWSSFGEFLSSLDLSFDFLATVTAPYNARTMCSCARSLGRFLALVFVWCLQVCEALWCVNQSGRVCTHTHTRAHPRFVLLCNDSPLPMLHATGVYVACMVFYQFCCL